MGAPFHFAENEVGQAFVAGTAPLASRTLKKATRKAAKTA
jgi:hypothetical protein